MGARFLGTLDSQPHCFLDKSYFEQRDCWVDCREPDMLWIDRQANIGYNNVFVTQTHDVKPDQFGRLSGRKIIIEKKAFITSWCKLYNCRIGEGAVVAMGSVVRSMQVPPWTMVAGNPAKVVKIWDPLVKDWVKV